SDGDGAIKAFRCRSSGETIPLHQVCDGRADCPDHSDEDAEDNHCHRVFQLYQLHCDRAITLFYFTSAIIVAFYLALLLRCSISFYRIRSLDFERGLIREEAAQLIAELNELSHG